MDWARTTARGYKKHLNFGIWCEKTRSVLRQLLLTYACRMNSCASDLRWCWAIRCRNAFYKFRCKCFKVLTVNDGQNVPFWYGMITNGQTRSRDSSTVNSTWWRHQMETFSALLAFCAGNSLFTGEFLAQRPVTRSFYVFFDAIALIMTSL